MNFLIPQWAPNVHPLIIHFPIVLLITAVGFHLLTLIFKRIEWLRTTTMSIYVLGTIAALAAYFTGRQAADSVMLPTAAFPVLSKHADYAFITLVYFSIITVIYVFFWWRSVEVKKWLQYILMLIAAIGMIFLFETGDHGGELVFKHGVGIYSVQEQDNSKQEPPENNFNQNFVIHENGSWELIPYEGAEQIMTDEFVWLVGKPEDVNITSDIVKGFGSFLTIENFGKTILFVAKDSLGSVQVDIKLNLFDFDGTFSIVHHVQDKQTFDFLTLEAGNIKLGRTEKGKTKTWEKKSFMTFEWFNLRVVNTGRHFRGYLNEELVIHSHNNELPAGPVGLQIKGKGGLFLKELRVKSLDK